MPSRAPMSMKMGFNYLFMIVLHDSMRPDEYGRTFYVGFWSPRKLNCPEQPLEPMNVAKSGTHIKFTSLCCSACFKEIYQGANSNKLRWNYRRLWERCPTSGQWFWHWLRWISHSSTGWRAILDVHAKRDEHRITAWPLPAVVRL